MDGGRREGHHRESSRDRRDEVRERERDRESDREVERRKRREQQRAEQGEQRPSASGRAAGMPPRPKSRAGDSEVRQVEQPAGMAKRGSANPLVAEAARLARERLAREEVVAAAAAGGSGSDHDSAPGRAAAPRRSWRDEGGGDNEMGGRGDEEEREEGEAEPGELRPEARDGGGGPVWAPLTSADKKRKHAPIVWRTPPKAQKLEQAAAAGGGMHHAQSSSGINTLAEGRAGGVSPGRPARTPEAQRPRSAAEIAQAELEAFATAQAELEEGDGGGYMKASPEMSSPEEEAHILRETTAPSPGKQGGGGDDEGEEASSPALHKPKPASRWLADDGEPDVGLGPVAGPARGPSPADDGGPGAEPALSSDEEEAGKEGQGAGSEVEEEEAPRKPTKRQVSMLEECRSVDRYEKLNRINEGTYGVVYRARDRETGEVCALKKVKLEKERDGFPLTSVREINILLSLHHPNIVDVSEVVVGSSLDSVFMVMEYAHHDLKAVMEGRMTQPFTVAEVKCLMQQLLSGVAYLHSHWVLHRDLKTSNILYTNRGELKLCDFGLARQYGSPLKPYTHMVVTLWYRAIELLLGVKTYSTAIDAWSCGCIMAELLSREALFAGKSEMDQINLIFKTLGTPTEETWPGLSKLPSFRKFNFASGYPNILRQKFPPPGGLVFDGRPTLSDAGFDLLSRLLDYCPERRISCEEALEHPWFREQPLPKDMALMPTFPPTNDVAHAHGAVAKRKAAAH